jgi:hypothetical protein
MHSSAPSRGFRCSNCWDLSMLIEVPRVEKRRTPLPKWLWILGAVILGAAAISVVLLATHWPFTEDAITRALQAASGRQVQIGSFSKTYFPPGCIAGNIRFLRHKHPEAQPIVTVDKLIVEGSIVGLFTSPKRLSAVRVVGMRMSIPPKGEESPASVPLNSGLGGASLAISKITADGVTLEFLPEKRGDKSFILKVDRLGIRDVGSGTRMSYRATLTNTQPPGVIQSEGKFGPWNPNDVGSTPVSGSFTYDNIDLGSFQSISGMGRARGQFSGPLGKIQTHGSVDVTAFHVDGSDHTVPLATTFDATVNGTNGDVLLNPVVTRFRGTQIEVRGGITGHEGEKGKTADFTLAVSKGRVDDLLYLFTKSQPGMSGDVTADGKFVWPPGPGKFLEKVRLDLVFGMGESRFTNRNTQDSIDRISESAGGEPKKEQNDDSRTVLSQLHGNIQVRKGVSTIPAATFDVPGAHATVHGTYNLLNQHVDLRGTLDTQGSLADTTTGLKALVLKAITPLFRKKGPMRLIPFEITGAYGNTSVGIDWKR